MVAVKADKAEIYQYLKELIDEALNELADFDSMFPDKSRAEDGVKEGEENERARGD